MAVDLGGRHPSGLGLSTGGGRGRPRAGIRQPAAPARPAPGRRLRWSDLGLLAALAWVVLPAPLSVRDAGWVERLESLPWLALAGLGLGVLLARTRLPGLAAHPLALGLGVETLAAVFSSARPTGSVGERVAWLGGRVSGWLEAVLGGGASNDLLVFALGMGTLAWVLGYVSAWLVFRTHAAWLAVTANAVALLVSLSYAPAALSGYLGWLLLGGLALLAADHLARRAEQWRAGSLAVERRVGAAVMLGSAAAALLVLALAWSLPSGGMNATVSAEWDRATAPWQGMERTFDRLFASLTGSPSAARGLNFGATIVPRGSFDLPDTPVLEVRSPLPLYWRATTLDRYTGRAMLGSDTAATRAAADAALLAEDQLPAERAEVRSEIRILAPRSAVLFAPEAPLRVDLAADVERRDPTDVASIRPATPLRRDDVYTVVSAVSTASAQQLRAAGQDYPSWVRERYLQLPRRLPPRVAELARQVTQGADNAYDRAAAIERYLRESFTYTTHVPEVPPDRDWVDYFLFDLRQGYCDFFSTSMVVLLRSLGVPARVAAGFAPGELDQATGLWLVRENRAHSWTEAYFPGYGWITFEPSAIRALPERGLAPTPTPAADASRGNPGPGRAGRLLDELDVPDDGAGGPAVGPSGPGSVLATPLGTALAGLFGVLSLAGLAVVGATLAWRRGLGELAWYQRPYAQAVRLAQWLGGVRLPASDTPHEVADTLARQAPSAAPAIRDLAQAYVEGTYAGRPPRANPAATWLAIRRQLARAFLERRLRALASGGRGERSGPKR